ncbi:hypothetical protein SCLCIDRAFT_1206705 [Scleroderma citrinum Foug A]|uniref:Uncharacterized protein n=1 Tax=Scleroderma citrinum Foug A TaxID=1036808 RepID=A0A0C3ERY8_9AGAM|nr:hypothetical protein SCLCIDRAFT_1206705 [Scleroderma citrinum Foug A]
MSELSQRSPMQPLLQKSSLPPQAQRPTNHQAVPPTTGVKRNADAMQGSSSSLRPPVQGAGHTRQPQQNAAAVRRPLVSPDPMASVEFKRMKR